MRLFGVLRRYECWDELIRLAGTPYLEPTDNEQEQVNRLAHLGIAHAATGDRAAAEPLRATLERLHLAPPAIPLVGNVNGEFYPTGPDAVLAMIDLLAAQVASPVQFVKGLNTLYEAGARIFIEVGPKKALHGFAEDVLGDRPDVLALFTNHPKVGEVASFNQALCGIHASGLGLGIGGAEKVELALAPQAPIAIAPTRAPQPGPAIPASGEARYLQLGHLFAEFLERGSHLLRGEETSAPEAPVVTGAAIGLPGGERVFSDDNVQHILDGEQEIDLIPDAAFATRCSDKHITRLVKSEWRGSALRVHRETRRTSSSWRRAFRSHSTSSRSSGVPAERVQAFDVVDGAGRRRRDRGASRRRHPAGDAVPEDHDQGHPLPERWGLPESLRDETGRDLRLGVSRAIDSFAGDEAFRPLPRPAPWRVDELETRDAAQSSPARSPRERGEQRSYLLRRDRPPPSRSSSARAAPRTEPYVFDRRFLFRVLSMAHAQFAEYIGARGPNTHVNSACASTTQAFAMAEDWIRAGRCRRVDRDRRRRRHLGSHVLDWFASGFLAIRRRGHRRSGVGRRRRALRPPGATA